MFYIDSGRPALPQNTSIPLAILNQDPLVDLAFVSKQQLKQRVHHGDDPSNGNIPLSTGMPTMTHI